MAICLIHGRIQLNYMGLKLNSKKKVIQVAVVHCALDLEPITKKSYDKSRRIVRGLFASSYGLINSDINGSLNILRKSGKCIPDLIKLKSDNGKLDSPKRIRVAC